MKSETSELIAMFANFLLYVQRLAGN